ncbi:Golgi apparatus membrane protein tvp23 [Xanthoria calcicola]
MERPQPRAGDLSCRLSSHPITLLFFLGFRISSLLFYILGSLFTKNFILVFIVTILLLAADFYYLKNIAGRRLVGLRWWNEVNTASGDSHWVFESQDRSGSAESGAPSQNATDKRFFWLALYAQPAWWVVLAIVSVVRLLNPIWLSLIVIALILTITNTLAFSRCDKFSQASSLASSAMYSGGMAKSLAGGLFSRLFRG